jgi:cell division protein FtsA
MPVRLGVPQHVTGLAENVKNPIYATAVGLLLYGQKQERDEMTRIDMNNGVKSFLVRIKSWFQGHF